MYPDFVIPGAAKSGTTALYGYLAQHPRIFLPQEKEPGFFSSDIPGGLTHLEEYRALFAAAPSGTLCGEASTRYLYSRVAIARLLAHNPAVKLIILLRNPVDAAQSLHSYAYRYGLEDSSDFEQAWHEQPAKLARRRLPGGGEILEYNYRLTYSYAEQVQRVMQHVPPEQRLFMLYEEFFAEPQRHYARVLQFLDLPPLLPEAFPAVNAHVGVRSARLEHWLRHPPPLVRRMYARVAPLLDSVGLNPLRHLRRANWQAGRRAELRPAFRAELERYFAPDVREVERLLGRQLWPLAQAPGGVEAAGEPRT